MILLPLRVKACGSMEGGEGMVLVGLLLSGVQGGVVDMIGDAGRDSVSNLGGSW